MGYFILLCVVILFGVICKLSDTHDQAKRRGDALKNTQVRCADCLNGTIPYENMTGCERIAFVFKKKFQDGLSFDLDALENVVNENIDYISLYPPNHPTAIAPSASSRKSKAKRRWGVERKNDRIY